MGKEPSFERLKELTTYLNDKERHLVENAYLFANAAHRGQNRKSGKPYIVHPLAAAETIAEYKLDAVTLAATLLHDVPEDTAHTQAEIQEKFGKEVAGLVDGVTKLSHIRLKKNWQDVYRELSQKPDSKNVNFGAFDRHVETLRKMFLAMSRDIRVILIKLADRLNNMETLDALPPEKRRRIAQETLEVYAPLANRLGMGRIKGRLEDLSFPYTNPTEFARLGKEVSDVYSDRERYIERLRRVLLKRLVGRGVTAEVHGRSKHLYSLWKKLRRHDQDLSKIYDLIAVRVLVPTMEDCYRVLGIIHEMWRPLHGRIKDYIATPKPNGYQSLHTTVFALGGRITEIQIRTYDMHHWAEYGIAAHWAYSERRNPVDLFSKILGRRDLAPAKLGWIEELAKLQQSLHDPSEWRKGVTLDFFEDRIFVFTPQGDILDLPSGATPVDFAFAVHSDIGTHCNGAKINGKLVPLSHPLENGDIIEILTNKKVHPTSDWLTYAKTSKARSHIKHAIHPTDTKQQPERR